MTNFIHLHHISLKVLVVNKSVAFYQRLFNLIPVVEHSTPGGRKVVHLQDEHANLVLELIEGVDVNPIDDVHIGFATDCLIKVLSRLQSLRIPIIRGPIKVGTESIIFIRDPDGYLIEINDGLQ